MLMPNLPNLSDLGCLTTNNHNNVYIIIYSINADMVLIGLLVFRVFDFSSSGFVKPEPLV